MRIYAESPRRATLQVAGDVLLVVWIVVWVRVALSVHDAVLRLGAPGEQLSAAGDGLAARLRDAGRTVSAVPLVGDQVRAPFEGAGDAAGQLARAGQAQVAAVDSLALWLGLALALGPVLLALAIWVPRRVRFVREAAAGARLVDSADDLDLFALRALAHQPLHRLARISDDPAGAWRERDATVIGRLAELELRDAGLWPTAQGRTPGRAGSPPAG